MCHVAAVAGDATHLPVGLPWYWPVTLTSAVLARLGSAVWAVHADGECYSGETVASLRFHCPLDAIRSGKRGPPPPADGLGKRPATQIRPFS